MLMHNFGGKWLRCIMGGVQMSNETPAFLDTWWRLRITYWCWWIVYGFGNNEVASIITWSIKECIDLAFSAGVFGWAKPFSCSYCCSRHIWFYDSGRLGRVVDSLNFLLSSGSFNMALSRAKTFARPKKTPALQASIDLPNKRSG